MCICSVSSGSLCLHRVMIRSSEPSPHAAVPPQLDKVCCRQTGVPGRESTKVPSAAAAAAECPSSFFGRNSGLLYSSKVSLVVLGPYFFFFVVVFLSLPSFRLSVLSFLSTIFFLLSLYLSLSIESKSSADASVRPSVHGSPEKCNLPSRNRVV